jgi:hypothetical protein
MTAWTLIVQFIYDYLTYFIVAAVFVGALIIANIVVAVVKLAKKRVDRDNKK